MGSPCVNRCELEPVTRNHCVSCGRTIAQIIEAGKQAAKDREETQHEKQKCPHILNKP